MVAGFVLFVREGGGLVLLKCAILYGMSETPTWAPILEIIGKYSFENIFP
jgi:hypothetical protein